MNLLDKTIGWFSPAAGLSRARMRAALAEIQRFEYDGAKNTRRTDGWFRPGTSANAEIGSAMVRLRDGARDMVRNNPLAAKAVLELATKAVGTGIRPNARTGDASVDKTLDETFVEWADQTRFWNKQHLSARAIVEAGEAVARFRARRTGDGLVVPFDVELLEPDLIDHTKNNALEAGYIMNGIEFDVIGREVAVWLYPAHPGDAVNTAWFRRKSALLSSRIPVRSADNPLSGVARAFREDRIGQTRGVSWFAPILSALWDLNGYEEAERVRKRIEACLSAFVTSPESDSLGGPALGAQIQSGADIVEEFRPGMVSRLRPGEQVTVAEPKAAGGYAEYTRRQDRLIASGLGLLYELLIGDFSQINYSSYRGGLLGFKNFIEYFQWLVLVPFWQQTWTRFVDACKIAGIVPPGTGYAVEWAPPAFELLDRMAEAEADEKELQIGKTTWPQMVAASGYDPQKQIDQITEWKTRLADAGVTFNAKAREPLPKPAA